MFTDVNYLLEKKVSYELSIYESSMTWFDIVNLVASIATAVGVILAAVGLWLAKIQSMTSFEDGVSNEYRQIVKLIPVRALLGDELSDEEFENSLNDIYNYIDFTNEQIYLRQQGRIRKATWNSWADGIETNLNRKSFKKAWEIIKEKSPNSFTELRRLEQQAYKVDPKSWKVS